MAGEPLKPILAALSGQTLSRPPWWLMRQAGRYLPEYRALRANAANFIEFCLTPTLAAEVTLQPIRRFGMDAAILFADILLIPRALGQSVEFREGGPVLEPISPDKGLRHLRLEGLSALDPVYETIARVRRELPARTTLIGFAGAPWTVATYMVEGGGSRDYPAAKGWAYRDPDGFAALLDLISEATVRYLARQIEAGAEVIQLFDSWAGVLPEPLFGRCVIGPTRSIVQQLKQHFPATPIIGFPRGAGPRYERYADETGVDAVALDTVVPLEMARDRLQSRVAVQGNLDPIALLTGGSALEAAVVRIRGALGSGPLVFNLGHGVLPQTPPEHVARLAQLLTEPI
ncbi:MAG: uroporphyrinogen decarboxylase [Alphaproteobacteria bacterium]|nr:uroporphyrinogen decarboxylase [Alphaproteobacteria bacterium]